MTPRDQHSKVGHAIRREARFRRPQDAYRVLLVAGDRVAAMEDDRRGVVVRVQPPGSAHNVVAVKEDRDGRVWRGAAFLWRRIP